MMGQKPFKVKPLGQIDILPPFDIGIEIPSINLIGFENIVHSAIDWSDFFQKLLSNLMKIGLTYTQYKLMMDLYEKQKASLSSKPDSSSATALLYSALLQSQQPQTTQQDITKIVALVIGGLAVILVLILLLKKEK